MGKRTRPRGTPLNAAERAEILAVANAVTKASANRYEREKAL